MSNIRLQRQVINRINWQQLGPEPGFHVICSSDHWRELLPGANCPFDFSTDVVIVVYAGEKPTGGHSVKIESLDATDQTVKVLYKQKQPGPDDMVTMAFTYPVDCVGIQKLQLPDGKIRFEFYCGSEQMGVVETSV